MKNITSTIILKPIYIYCASKIFGGTEVLFARLAKYLDGNGFQVFLVAEENDVVPNMCPEIPRIYIGNGMKVQPGIVVTSFKEILKAIAWAENSANMNIFAWVLHPHEVISPMFPLAGTLTRIFNYATARLWVRLNVPQMKRAKIFLKYLGDGCGLCFMDGATYRSASYFYSPFFESKFPCVVPIPSIIRTSVWNVKKRFNKVIKIGYLGRINDFKYSALSQFLIEGSKEGRIRSLSVELIAIGGGTFTNNLQHLCDKKGIRLAIYPPMPLEEALECIGKECHFAVAMGTAALDLAAAGIPTLRIDPFMGYVFANASYRFMHEIDDLTLGEYMDFPLYKSGKIDISGVFDAIEKLDILSFEGRRYVDAHHNIENVFSDLIIKLSGVTANTGELIQIARRCANYTRVFQLFAEKAERLKLELGRIL